MFSNLSLKKAVFSLVFISLVVPFVMQKTIYPFYRFGMFAEPIRHEVQKEQFAIIKETKNGESILLDSNEIGFGKSVFGYLLRNYYYRGEGKQFLKKIEPSLSEKVNIKSLKLVRVMDRDSTIVNSIEVDG